VLLFPTKLAQLIHAAKRFTPIAGLIAESFMPQAFNAYRDTKLHERGSDPKWLNKLKHLDFSFLKSTVPYASTSRLL